MHYIMMLKGRVAQRLEHVATNYGVGGSNPPLPNFEIIALILINVTILVVIFTWGVAKW